MGIQYRTSGRLAKEVSQLVGDSIKMNVERYLLPLTITVTISASSKDQADVKVQYAGTVTRLYCVGQAKLEEYLPEEKTDEE